MAAAYGRAGRPRAAWRAFRAQGERTAVGEALRAELERQLPAAGFAVLAAETFLQRAAELGVDPRELDARAAEQLEAELELAALLRGGPAEFRVETAHAQARAAGYPLTFTYEPE
ncbi:MAG: hypothetical protein AB7N76_36890 [Planctomycetota bacterium]